jgi:hypothetical protein
MPDRSSARRTRAYSWKSFDRRLGRKIEAEICHQGSPCCPLCGLYLEARPGTRFHRYLVLDATGYDLDCRDCRRFWSVILHTPRSTRLLRMRRFVAAVRAVRAGVPAGGERARPREMMAATAA